MNADRAIHFIGGLMEAWMSNNPDKLSLDIYKTAHASSACRAKHKDWLEDILKIEKELIEAGIIGEFPIHKVMIGIGELTTEQRLELFKKVREEFCLQCGERKSLAEQMVSVEHVTVERHENEDEVQEGRATCDHQKEPARAS